ncbi:hypothetical protein [Nocardia nova]|uniref:hypothetical protein n=1 Tax=Nocardia nova TaxID=37330 RepID=UPI002738DAA3|nr:hypothetical protein [Nocardia nova]
MDDLVQVTFGDLTSEFMVLPRGATFLTYEQFADAYEVLRITTNGFSLLDVDRCWEAARKNAICFVVIRSILGFTGPEWQELAVTQTGVSFSNNWTRNLDKEVRAKPKYFQTQGRRGNVTTERVTALFEAACNVINAGAPEVGDDNIHRLNKIDTKHGLEGVRHLSQQHVPYAVLLYERFLGRSFAGYRDSISGLVGDVMESAIEDQLNSAGIVHRRTRRAEKIPGFAQAPDFFIPDEFNSKVIIEAKITGDDGTARDKVSRILRLTHMRDERIAKGEPSFQVIACIDGRGFGVRRRDMQQLIIATHGKVFTTNRLEDLVAYTDLSKFVTKP